MVEVIPLSPGHIRSGFICENKTITNFFVNNARRDHEAYKVRVFVACEQNEAEPLGFYSFVLRSLALEEGNEEAKEKFSRVASIPVIYLAMIGRHEDCKGKGIGEILIQDAFKRAVNIAENAGAYAIALDALNEKVADIYSEFGFERFVPEELKMFIPLKTIREALE